MRIAFVVLSILAVALAVAVVHDAHAAEPGIMAVPGFAPIPPQAQASAMAVPEPGPEYVSALLVVHCRKVEALVLIDSHGEQHPYHGKEATLAQVLTMLSPVPADKVTQVTVTCPGELGL